MVGDIQPNQNSQYGRNFDKIDLFDDKNESK